MRPRIPVLLVLTACQAGPIQGGIQKPEAEELLSRQAEAWNRGDLEGFVSFYSAGLTFLGADGLIRGDADLVERYRARYPDAEARGRLSLEILEFRPLGDTAALLLGRYSLDRAEPASGFFTLVLERTAGGLRVTHDHTTAADGSRP